MHLLDSPFGFLGENRKRVSEEKGGTTGEYILHPVLVTPVFTVGKILGSNNLLVIRSFVRGHLAVFICAPKRSTHAHLRFFQL